jgi:hypothetical protein
MKYTGKSVAAKNTTNDPWPCIIHGRQSCSKRYCQGDDLANYSYVGSQMYVVIESLVRMYVAGTKIM